MAATPQWPCSRCTRASCSWISDLGSASFFFFLSLCIVHSNSSSFTRYVLRTDGLCCPHCIQRCVSTLPLYRVGHTGQHPNSSVVHYVSPCAGTVSFPLIDGLFGRRHPPMPGKLPRWRRVHSAGSCLPKAGRRLYPLVAWRVRPGDVESPCATKGSQRRLLPLQDGKSLS